MALRFLNSGYFAGKVGIGTETPGAKLHVTRSSAEYNATPIVKIFDANPSQRAALEVIGYSNLGGFRINAADGIRGFYKSTAGGSFGLATGGDDPITFTQLDSAERMRIAVGGNVGIGTTSPSRQLDVEGVIRFSSNSNQAVNGYGEIYTSYSYGKGQIFIAPEAVTSPTNFHPNGGVTIGPANTSPPANGLIVSGNVGIGTTTPQQKLDVVGRVRASYDTSNYYEIGASSAGGFVVGKSSGVETVNIRTYGNSHFTGGNVGIGTTSPDTKLDIEDSNPFVTIQGSSSSYVNAGVQFISNQASTARGLGNFYYSAHSDVEWFSGLPYNDNDAFVINRNASYTVPSSQSSPPGIGASAGTLLKVSSTGAIQFNNYSGTNKTGTPTYILGTDNSGNVVKVLGGDIPGVPAGSGTLNTVPLWTPDGDTLGNSIITQPSTSTIDVDGNILISDTGNDKYFGSNVNLILNADADAQSGDSARNIIFQNRGSEKMRITADGNVGIGVTSPTSRFHIYESINPSSGDLITSKIYSNGTVTANGNTRTGLDVETNRTGWYNSDATSGNFKISNNNRIGNSDLIGVKSLATVDVDNVYSGLTAAGSLTALYGKVTTTYTAGSGPVAKGYGLRIDAPEVATNSEIDTYYGTYIDGATVSGTLTNKYALVTEANAGNVGIGTTSPASKFEVYGGNSGVNDVDRYIRFKASNGEKRFDFYVGGTGNASSLGMYTSDGTTKNVQIASGGTSYFNGGNVGIGATSPSYKLTAYGSSTNSEIVASFGSANDQNEYTAIGLSGFIASNGATKAGLALKRTGTYGTGELHFLNNNTLDNSDMTLSDSKMMINSSGNVGIGTTSPDFKLDVNGIIRSENSSEVGTLYLGNTAQSQIPGGAIIGQRSPSYSSTGNLLFQVPTWGAGTDYGLTTQMSIEVSTSDTKKATISMIPFGGNVEITNALLSNQENTNVDTGAEVVAQVSTSTYTAAFFDFVIKKVGNIRSGTVYACHDGTNVEFTETSTNDLGDTSDVTLSVDKSGTNLRLIATVTSDDWIIKSLIRAI